MTNREWLFSMSDAELADMLGTHHSCDYCLYDTKCLDGIHDCEEGTVAWLREEHKDGEE